MSGYINPPIYMDCPGAGGSGNLSDGSNAHCQFCHEWLPLAGGRVPEHRTVDVLAILDRGYK